MKKLFILSIVFLPVISLASFDRNLQYGSTGEDVKELQEFLTEQSFYTGPITGNFYSLTRAALIKYQKANTISPATGYFGPITRTKINSILAQQESASNAQAIQETGSVTISTKTDAVTALQEQINALLAQLQQLNTQVQSQTTIQQQTQTTLQQTQQSVQQIQQNTAPVPAPAPGPTPNPPPTPTPVPSNALVTVQTVRGCYINSGGTGLFNNKPCEVIVWYTENGKRANATISVTSETGTFNVATKATSVMSDGLPAAMFEYTPNQLLITPNYKTGRWCAQLAPTPYSVCSDNGGVTWQHAIKISASANGVTSPVGVFSSSTHYPSEPYLESVPSFPESVDPVIITRKIWQEDHTGKSYPVNIPVYPRGYTGSATIGIFMVGGGDEPVNIQDHGRIYESDLGNIFTFNTYDGRISLGADLSNVPVGTHTFTLKQLVAVGATSGYTRTIQGLPLTFTFTIQ